MKLIDYEHLEMIPLTVPTDVDSDSYIAGAEAVADVIDSSTILAVSCNHCEYYDPIKSQCTHRLGLKGYLRKYVDFCSRGSWNPHE